MAAYRDTLHASLARVESLRRENAVLQTRLCASSMTARQDVQRLGLFGWLLVCVIAMSVIALVYIATG